jgi:hypothetical protein
MSEVPKNPFREREKLRMAAEARKREETRAETQLSILQEQANKADQQRQAEERHEHVERRNWRKELALAKFQLKSAQCLNCITASAAAFALLAAIGVICSVLEARKATIEANRAWIAPLSAEFSDAPRIGENWFVVVHYRNVGREPALGLVWNPDSGTKNGSPLLVENSSANSNDLRPE